jgi:predicted nucleic acid-binding protein
MANPRGSVPAGRPAKLHVAEPPTSYSLLPRLVADATVLAALIFEEAEHLQAEALLRGRAVAAPNLVDYEMTSVALKKLRRDRLPAGTVIGALEDFAAFPLERHSVAGIAVLELAQRYKLSAYDAAYLWLSAELGVPLATFDDQLAEAATKHLRSDQAGGAG